MRENLIISLTLGRSLNDNDDATYYYVYNYFLVNGNSNDSVTINYNGVSMDLPCGFSMPGIINNISVTASMSSATGNTGNYIHNTTGTTANYTGAVSKTPGVTVFGYRYKKTMF